MMGTCSLSSNPRLLPPTVQSLFTMAVILLSFSATGTANVRLNNISEEARPVLKDAEEIFVVEMKKDRIIRDYMASVRIVHDVKSLIA